MRGWWQHWGSAVCVPHRLLQCLCVQRMCMYMAEGPEPVYTHTGNVIRHTGK